MNKYNEDLINIVKEINLGVEIGKMKIGILMYADDVLVVASNTHELNQLLKLCENYGIDWQICWNPDKTQYIAFGPKPKKKDEHILFCNAQIEQVDNVKYLGVDINKNLIKQNTLATDDPNFLKHFMHHRNSASTQQKFLLK